VLSRADPNKDDAAIAASTIDKTLLFMI
jgi:hypothetical protein